MRGLWVPIVLSLTLAGCSEAPPTLAGGKPVAHWVTALRSPDARLRRTAARKLGNVGPADPKAIPALAAALDDTDPAVRGEAALALRKAGPRAREALPALERLRQNDAHPWVRDCADQAVAGLRGGPAGER